MKNLLARGGIEFLAVLLGITGSLWIDEKRQSAQQDAHQRTVLEAVYEDILATEEFIKNGRDPAFKADSAWMDFFANHWGNMNVDSVAVELGKTGMRTSFHNTFFDYREFHPPISSMNMIVQDGSLKEINNMAIRKKINQLVKTDLGFVLKNVESEIEMQIGFRRMLIEQNDPQLARILSVSQQELRDRFDDNVENYDRHIEELKYFLTKDYARSYINLKNRQRYFVMLFVKGFKKTLFELKALVEAELGLTEGTT